MDSLRGAIEVAEDNPGGECGASKIRIGIPVIPTIGCLRDVLKDCSGGSRSNSPDDLVFYAGKVHELKSASLCSNPSVPDKWFGKSALEVAE